MTLQKHLGEVKTTLSRWSVWGILTIAAWEGPAQTLLNTYGDWVPDWFKHGFSITLILCTLIASHIPQKNLKIVKADSETSQ